MFYQLHSFVEIILLLIGLAAFVAVAWRRPATGAAAVLFLAPAYLLKINLGHLPLNVLEILIWLLAGVWAAQEVRICRHSGERHNPDRNFESGFRLKAGMTIEKLAAIKKNFYFLPILLILAGAILSAIFSGDRRASVGLLNGYFLSPLLFAAILYDVIKTKEQFKKLIWALVFSGIAAAVVGTFCLLAGRLTFDGRLAAFYSSPNQLAMYLAPALLLLLGFWPAAKNRRQRFLFIIGCLPLAVVLYFTFSYAAWLAVLGAMVFVILVYGAGNKKNLFAAAWLLAVFLLLFVSQLSGQKLNNLLAFSRSSIESRLMIWRAAWQIGLDHWLFGIGPGMFERYYLAYQTRFATPYLEWAVPQPHNIFLAFWLQAGLIGLIGFGWLVINFFRYFYRLAKKQPPALALAAVMVYFLAHGLVDATFWKNDLALIFWSIVVLNYRAGRRFYS